MSEMLISVITPVYNRAELLKKCCESLKRQTDQTFEWIVADDGSTDATRQIVSDFSKDCSFEIKYVYKENGGKHTALNAAHPLISGQYVLMLDSDDTLTPDAIETVRRGWKKYEGNPEVGMVVWLKGSSADDPNCDVKQDGIIVDYQSYPRHIIHSLDCCEVLRTDLFLKYPFPVFENEKFISEGALWNRAMAEHKCVYQNKVIYLCEYLEGGLTKSGKRLRIRNPYGGMYTSFLRMGSRHRTKEKVKGSILYSCYGFFAGMRPAEILKHDKGHSLLKAGGIVPGYILYRKWKKTYSD